MSKTTEDPKTKLSELAQEHAGLSGKQDKAARFRCRMIRGRAQSIIIKSVKGAAAQDAAFADWQTAAKGTPPASKPDGKRKSPASPSKRGLILGKFFR